MHHALSTVTEKLISDRTRACLIVMLGVRALKHVYHSFEEVECSCLLKDYLTKTK